MPAVETPVAPASAPAAPAVTAPAAGATVSAPPVTAAPAALAVAKAETPASPAPVATDVPRGTEKPADAKAPDAPRSLLADEPAAKTGEAAPAGEPVKTGEAAPAEFKVEAPKDSPLASTTVEKLTAWAKEAKVPQAEAQKLVEALHAESVAGQTAAKAKAETDYKALYKTWGDELKADKEVGGDNLAQSLTQAKRTLRVFATAEERAFLEATPFGNHPVLVKILARAGSKLSEDGYIGGGTNPPAPKTAAQTVYGNDHTKPSSFR